MAYAVFRRTRHENFARVGGPITTTTLVDASLTNGTLYTYRVRALTGNGGSDFSNPAAATPTAPTSPPPAAPAAPGNLSAIAGNGQIQLSWNAVTGATDYRIFRTTNGTFGTTPIATVTTTTYLNTGLTNGTTYSYRVAAHNAGGDGPFSAVVSTAPGAAPGVPTNVSASAGNAMVTLSWTAVATATSYNVYRGTTTNGQAAPPLATGLTAPAFVDSPVTNGVTYFYKVTAVNAFGESTRSTEASASPMGRHRRRHHHRRRVIRRVVNLPLPASGDVGSAARRHRARAIAWHRRVPRRTVRRAALAVSGGALRQLSRRRRNTSWPCAHRAGPAAPARGVGAAQDLGRVGGRGDNALGDPHLLPAAVDGAFGNYRDLMRDHHAQSGDGPLPEHAEQPQPAGDGRPPNENYARELMQLFTLGTARLNPDGTPVLDGSGAPMPTYTEADVKALARILTGWTFGDGNPGNDSHGRAPENYARADGGRWRAITT